MARAVTLAAASALQIVAASRSSAAPAPAPAAALRNLSPLLEAGATPDAIRAASQVNLPGMNTSFAGFFTVNASANAQHFFWYFPPANGASGVPTVAWLQGGPGGSSLFGLFAENGPYRLTPDLQPTFLNTSWCVEFGCVYLDNPRNTGYSHADSYCTDWQCYGEDGASFYAQFVAAYGLGGAPFYITGESYGGKYVPAIAASVLRANAAIAAGTLKGRATVPLAGIAIGNGFTDPALMITRYPSLMRDTGLIDDAQMLVAQSYVANISALLAAGDYVDAWQVWDAFLNGDVHPFGAWFQNVTGLNDYFNFAEASAPAAFAYPGAYVVQPFVRAALGVGQTPYQDGNTQVEISLGGDVMFSQKDNLNFILQSGVNVLLYNGALDIICGAPLTDAYIPTLQWPGAPAYAAASRAIWHEPATGNVAGWATGPAGGLTRVVIKGAGHISPYDQPGRTQDMITRFIKGQPWN